jgi:hypothetical protein
MKKFLIECDKRIIVRLQLKMKKLKEKIQREVGS